MENINLKTGYNRSIIISEAITLKVVIGGRFGMVSAIHFNLYEKRNKPPEITGCPESLDEGTTGTFKVVAERYKTLCPNNI